MPTQRNYNDIKESILKELHQGKNIDQLSEDYFIPKSLIKEWEDKEKQDDNLNVFTDNLLKNRLDKIPNDKKRKKYLEVKCIKKVLFYIILTAGIVILAYSFKHQICNATEHQKKNSIYLKLDAILKLNKGIETSIISNEEKKLRLLHQTVRLMKKTPAVEKIVKVRKEYHKQINVISNSNLQKDSI